MRWLLVVPSQRVRPAYYKVIDRRKSYTSIIYGYKLIEVILFATYWLD